MTLTSSLRKRPCPICKSYDDSNVLFRSNIVESMLDNLAFSSRKSPEFMNLTLACCPTCDLLYAPSSPTIEFLHNAYHNTGYDSGEEAQFAANSYAKWLKNIDPYLPDHQAALEVGAGNGAFLQHLLTAGFENVIGIEPSIDAISDAPAHIKKYMATGMFQAKDFPANHFSLIAIFQTLEHIDQPDQFLTDAFNLLKPGGVLMLVSHNYRNWLMRLLGQKSPIIDIEHLQLFSPQSLRFSLEKSGFQHIKIHSLRNTYPLHYWVKLLPIPRKFKNLLYYYLKHGTGSTIGSLKVGMHVGNLIAWGQK